MSGEKTDKKFKYILFDGFRYGLMFNAFFLVIYFSSIDEKDNLVLGLSICFIFLLAVVNRVILWLLVKARNVIKDSIKKDKR